MKQVISNKNHPSSFRDPSGFIFFRNNSIYRHVNLIYKDHYDHLMNSGLYNALVNAQLLIPHIEVDSDDVYSDEAYKIIQPEMVPFISYPYEWCFSQLKHAALATLKIQKISLEFGMLLKDSTAYNIQFRNCKPILIDTLSFEKYREGEPWLPYRQFCQHFFAPLALMAYKDIRLNQLSRIYIDGVPLDLSSSLLPFRTYFRFSLISHIHLHARSQKHFSDKNVDTKAYKMRLLSLLGLIDNLESAIKKLKWKRQGTQWTDYYEHTNYCSEAFQHKKQIVVEFLDRINPKLVWDLGANIGTFSRICSEKGLLTISFDMDEAAVEKNYLECVAKDVTNIFPLLLDLTNPSPGIGWENNERISFIERGKADTLLALALIHHLRISNNVPFKKIARFFSNICKVLIIEFIPKNDSQVQKLFSSRKDIFVDYTEQSFEQEFRRYFAIQDIVKIRASKRILYLMKSR